MFAFIITIGISGLLIYKALSSIKNTDSIEDTSETESLKDNYYSSNNQKLIYHRLTTGYYDDDPDRYYELYGRATGPLV